MYVHYPDRILSISPLFVFQKRLIILHRMSLVIVDVRCISVAVLLYIPNAFNTLIDVYVYTETYSYFIEIYKYLTFDKGFVDENEISHFEILDGTFPVEGLCKNARETRIEQLK